MSTNPFTQEIWTLSRVIKLSLTPKKGKYLNLNLNYLIFSQLISEDKSDRKIKTANGMVKKGSLGLSKNQAMSSSLISNEIKDKDKSQSQQQQGMNSTFNYKSQAPTLNKPLINQQYESSSKYPKELNEYAPNVPATTKNNKSKLNLFQNKNV